MEINLNGNGFGNVSMGREAQAPTEIDAGRAAKGVDAKRETKDAVTFTNASAGLSSAEPVADVPDAALSRDDALGKMINAAFNLPPPPMPEFT